MSKQLLVDYIPFEITPQVLTEARSANPNMPLRLRGILQRAGQKNFNGRIYPMTVLQREAKKYEEVIKERRALGELDHPDSSQINLKNVSHNVCEISWNGNDLVGTIEILTTPNGNIARELIKNNVRLGISSRGLGSVLPINENTVEVQDDFELLCFDLVSSPSTRGAYMNMTEGIIKEGANQPIVADRKSLDKYLQIETIMRDILTEIR
jgi:hypothetical protein